MRKPIEATCADTWCVKPAVLNRVKSNAKRRREAKEKGESVQLKRQPQGPRESHVVEFTGVESLAPQPYDTHI